MSATQHWGGYTGKKNVKRMLSLRGEIFSRKVLLDRKRAREKEIEIKLEEVERQRTVYLPISTGDYCLVVSISIR